MFGFKGKWATDVEEERRLFYVAMTRVKELLYITNALKRSLFGSLGPREPSRFIAEIPARFTKTREFKTKKRPPQGKLF